MTSISGSCLCKAVTYSVEGDLTPILACHCSQCAKTSGNYAAMTSCAESSLKIADTGTLAWFQSSAEVRRGFCTRCGGNLFWKQNGSDVVYITAGTLDQPTGLKIAEHIFVASKSDYYDIADGRPQKTEW